MIKSCKDDILQHRGLTLCYDRAMRKTYWNPVIGLPLAKARYLAGKKPEARSTTCDEGLLPLSFLFTASVVFICGEWRFNLRRVVFLPLVARCAPRLRLWGPNTFFSIRNQFTGLTPCAVICRPYRTLLSQLRYTPLAIKNASLYNSERFFPQPKTYSSAINNAPLRNQVLIMR